jgi:hypothetical protein
MLSLEVEIALVAVFVNGEEQDDVKESRRCGWCSFEKKVVVGDRLLLILLSLECCLAAMATAPFRLSLLPPKPTMLLSVDESIPIVQGEDDDEEGQSRFLLLREKNVRCIFFASLNLLSMMSLRRKEEEEEEERRGPLMLLVDVFDEVVCLRCRPWRIDGDVDDKIWCI